VGEALVMKAQVADFDEDEVLPSSEIEGALAAIKGAGCRNIVYYPHRADLPFELIRKYFADLCSSSKVYLPLVATHAPAGPVNLTADSPANDQNPAWSPDGERILFTSGRSGNNELWLMDSDGSAPTALTSNGAENVNLPGRAWCPGNDRIVFASDVESENDEIFSIASDGSDRQRLTTTDGRNWEPSWSPDCRQIVFQSDRSGNWDIWRMNADGSNPVRLTDDPADDGQPNWSPDGTTIVFQSNRSGNWDIWTMDVNGRSLTNVTSDPAEDTDHRRPRLRRRALLVARWKPHRLRVHAERQSGHLGG